MNHDTQHTDGPGQLWIWQNIGNSIKDADADRDGEWDQGRIRASIIENIGDVFYDSPWSGVETGTILHLPYGVWTQGGVMEADGVWDFLSSKYHAGHYINTRRNYVARGYRLMDYVGAFHPAKHDTSTDHARSTARLIRHFGATDICIDTLHGPSGIGDTFHQLDFIDDMEQHGVRVWGEPANHGFKRRSAAIWRWYEQFGKKPRPGYDIVIFNGHTTTDGSKWNERHVYQALLSGVDIALPGEWGLRGHVDDMNGFIEVVKGCVQGDAGSLKLAYRAMTS